METAQIVLLIITITGAVKSFIPKKWVPIVPIVLGLGLSIALEADIASVLDGVLVGGASVGLYMIGKGAIKPKTTIENIETIIGKIESQEK